MIRALDHKRQYPDTSYEELESLYKVNRCAIHRRHTEQVLN